LTAVDKVYNASSTAIVTGTAALLTPSSPGSGTSADGKSFTGDTLFLSGTAAGSFANANAGVNKVVTVTGLSLTGSDASNYTLPDPTLTATIEPANATIDAEGFTVTYDGNAHSITYSGTGVNGESLDGYIDIIGDSFTNAGSYRSYWFFTHPQGNYYPLEGTVDSTINQAMITVTADAQYKTYGDSDPALTYQITSGMLYGSD
jgi:hypothetical protein